MIQTVVKIQGCTTRKGRRAFVEKRFDRHGIAAGPIRFYEVIAPDWTGVRQAVASYDTTGARTIGHSNVNAETVEFYVRTIGGSKTASSVRPLPLGTTANNARQAVNWYPNAAS